MSAAAAPKPQLSLQERIQRTRRRNRTQSTATSVTASATSVESGSVAASATSTEENKATTYAPLNTEAPSSEVNNQHHAIGSPMRSSPRRDAESLAKRRERIQRRTRAAAAAQRATDTQPQQEKHQQQEEPPAPPEPQRERQQILTVEKWPPWSSNAVKQERTNATRGTAYYKKAGSALKAFLDDHEKKAQQQSQPVSPERNANSEQSRPKSPWARQAPQYSYETKAQLQQQHLSPERSDNTDSRPKSPWARPDAKAPQYSHEKKPQPQQQHLSPERSDDTENRPKSPWARPDAKAPQYRSSWTRPSPTKETAEPTASDETSPKKASWVKSAPEPVQQDEAATAPVEATSAKASWARSGATTPSRSWTPSNGKKAQWQRRDAANEQQQQAQDESVPPPVTSHQQKAPWMRPSPAEDSQSPAVSPEKEEQPAANYRQKAPWARPTTEPEPTVSPQKAPRQQQKASSARPAAPESSADPAAVESQQEHASPAKKAPWMKSGPSEPPENEAAPMRPTTPVAEKRRWVRPGPVETNPDPSPRKTAPWEVRGRGTPSWLKPTSTEPVEDETPSIEPTASKETNRFAWQDTGGGNVTRRAPWARQTPSSGNSVSSEASSSAAPSISSSTMKAPWMKSARVENGPASRPTTPGAESKRWVRPGTGSNSEVNVGERRKITPWARQAPSSGNSVASESSTSVSSPKKASWTNSAPEEPAVEEPAPARPTTLLAEKKRWVRAGASNTSNSGDLSAHMAKWKTASWARHVGGRSIASESSAKSSVSAYSGKKVTLAKPAPPEPNEDELALPEPPTPDAAQKRWGRPAAKERSQSPWTISKTGQWQRQKPDALSPESAPTDEGESMAPSDQDQQSPPLRPADDSRPSPSRPIDQQKAPWVRPTVDTANTASKRPAPWARHVASEGNVTPMSHSFSPEQALAKDSSPEKNHAEETTGHVDEANDRKSRWPWKSQRQQTPQQMRTPPLAQHKAVVGESPSKGDVRSNRGRPMSPSPHGSLFSAPSDEGDLRSPPWVRSTAKKLMESPSSPSQQILSEVKTRREQSAHDGDGGKIESPWQRQHEMSSHKEIPDHEMQSSVFNQATSVVSFGGAVIETPKSVNVSSIRNAFSSGNSAPRPRSLPPPKRRLRKAFTPQNSWKGPVPEDAPTDEKAPQEVAAPQAAEVTMPQLPKEGTSPGQPTPGKLPPPSWKRGVSPGEAASTAPLRSSKSPASPWPKVDSSPGESFSARSPAWAKRGNSPGQVTSTAKSDTQTTSQPPTPTRLFSRSAVSGQSSPARTPRPSWNERATSPGPTYSSAKSESGAMSPQPRVPYSPGQSSPAPSPQHPWMRRWTGSGQTSPKPSWKASDVSPAQTSPPRPAWEVRSEPGGGFLSNSPSLSWESDKLGEAGDDRAPPGLRWLQHKESPVATTSTTTSPGTPDSKKSNPSAGGSANSPRDRSMQESDMQQQEFVDHSLDISSKNMSFEEERTTVEWPQDSQEMAPSSPADSDHQGSTVGSTTKSLAQMAAESVFAVDYELMMAQAMKHETDDDDVSHSSSGVTGVTPATKDLPDEVKALLERSMGMSSGDSPSRPYGEESGAYEADFGTDGSSRRQSDSTWPSPKEDSPDLSVPRLSPSAKDSHHVGPASPTRQVRRALNFSPTDDDEHEVPTETLEKMTLENPNDGDSAPNDTEKEAPSSSEEKQKEETADSRNFLSMSNSLNYGLEQESTIDFGLPTDFTIDMSPDSPRASPEKATPSSKKDSHIVFGEPKSFGAAGGEIISMKAPSILDRGHAIEEWEGSLSAAAKGPPPAPIASATSPARNAKGAKHVLEFFSHEESKVDAAKAADATEDTVDWAARDPDFGPTTEDLKVLKDWHRHGSKEVPWPTDGFDSQDAFFQDGDPFATSNNQSGFSIESASAFNPFAEDEEDAFDFHSSDNGKFFSPYGDEKAQSASLEQQGTPRRLAPSRRDFKHRQTEQRYDDYYAQQAKQESSDDWGDDYYTQQAMSNGSWRGKHPGNSLLEEI